MEKDAAKSFSGKVCISVDIQPEYSDAFTFKVFDYTRFLNLNCDRFNDLVLLYNGQDTFDMISQNDYQDWLIENGLDEEVLDKITFIDKGYAFFRYCIDSGIDDADIVGFVKFMYKNNVLDSREMTRDLWAQYLRENRRLSKKTVYDLLKVSADCINIPDLMTDLRRYNNIVLIGGGQNECLKEVEIALDALDKNYIKYNKFIY